MTYPLRECLRGKFAQFRVHFPNYYGNFGKISIIVRKVHSEPHLNIRAVTVFRDRKPLNGIGGSTDDEREKL